MTELDIEKLRRLRDRRWEPGLTESAAIGELQAALPAIIAALEDREDYRLRLKAYNDVYIEISKKLDAALEDRDRLLRQNAVLDEDFTSVTFQLKAALEDRDRLRADVRKLAEHFELRHDEHGWSYTEDGVSVGLELELPALRAALEGPQWRMTAAI